MSLWVGAIALAALLAFDYQDRRRKAWRDKWTTRSSVLPSGRGLTVYEPAGLSSAVLSAIPDDELSDEELTRKVGLEAAMENYRREAAEFAKWAKCAQEIADLPECAHD